MCKDILDILGENTDLTDKKAATAAAIEKVKNMDMDQAQEVFNNSLCKNKFAHQNCPLMTILKASAGVPAQKPA